MGELSLSIQISFLDLSDRKFVLSLLFGNIFVVSVLSQCILLVCV